MDSQKAAVTARPFLPRIVRLFPGALFIAGYVGILAYFSLVDVYHRHFFSSDQTIVYALMRSAFTCYLFWIVSFSGMLLLHLFDAGPSTRRLDRFAWGFFVGAAAWTVFMLALGYLGLYTRTIAMLVTIPLVAVSAGSVRDALRSVHLYLQQLRRRDAITIMLTVLMIACGLILMMVKGLYPAGGHDYFTHYHYYFLSVLKHQNLWPNEVWYHYYYDKAMGLFFLAMLLTDPLGPSLATACFVAATAIAVFDLVRRSDSGRTAFPYVAVILYFVLFTFTASSGLYAGNGGWGDFQKPHETSSAFLIAILWMSVRLIGAPGGHQRMWWFGAAACAFVIASVTFVSALLCGLFFGMLVVACLAWRQWRKAALFFYLGLVTAAGLVAVLVLNYATTGLPLDNGIEYFWPIIDLRKLERWGVLAEIVPLMAGRLAFAHDALPLASQEMAMFVRRVLRTEIAGWLYLVTIGVLILWIVYVRRRSIPSRSGWSLTDRLPAPGMQTRLLLPLACAAVLLIATLLATITIGRTQPISFVRYASFDLPLLLAITLAVWQVMLNASPSWLAVLARGVIPIALLVLTLSTLPSSFRSGFGEVVANAGRFAGGRYSIYDAYVDQKGWPGRSPDGAVRPWALAVWQQLGPNVRFWTFGVHTYCMLPGCRPEAMNSYRLSPHALDILFGPPDQAKTILQQEELNYFLVEMDDGINDQLMCSALFSPDQIGQWLGVKWTDGTHFLLTWLDAGAEPLSGEWIELYRQKAAGAACGFWPLLHNLAAQLPQNPRRGRDLVMPWSKP